MRPWAALNGFWVRHPVREIPVRDRPEVPSFGGVLFEPFPGLFFELEPEPFGDALLDPPDENGGRADPGDIGRLVGGKQRDPLVGQLPFQLEGIVGVAGGPFDVFDYHGREPGLWGFRLGQQISQPAVPGQAPGGELIVGAVPA